jgi:hypothetical protein
VIFKIKRVANIAEEEDVAASGIGLISSKLSQARIEKSGYTYE